ncbi:extensin-like [Rana temporaria]|uniref:extensin-like n=1 Tax=Rana temporaria TaxID=8407 RepID=UPI001AADC7D1|nr:extensin-like [Rana temporaria]
MSTEGNSYEGVDFGHQDNPPPYYDNATPQSLPVMNTTQPTFYLPPSDYSESQPGGMVNPPPYHINNPSEGTFPGPMVIPSPEPAHPQEMGISHPQPSNNRKKCIQKPLPMYNPELLTPQIPRPTVPEAFPLPTMIPGMMAPLQDLQNSPVPGTEFVHTVQPMVVTTQTTVISTHTPPCKDYLTWSILNIIFCCFIFGTVALIFSLQTRSAKRRRDWDLAMEKSHKAFRFNVAAITFTCCLAASIIPAVYRLNYYSYTSYHG